MKMKLFCAAAALTFAGASQAAFADTAPTPEFTVNATAAVVSSYKFRGIGQSNNQPAFQGSITVTDKSGFYLSTWGSSTYDNLSVNAQNGFTSQAPVGPGGTEIDVYGGYSHALGKSGVTADGGLYGWIYPNAPLNNYWEVYGDLSKSYGPVGAKVGLNWAPSQHLFDVNGAAHHYNMYEYFELTYTPTQLPALTLHGHIGHTGGGEDYFNNKEYIDFTVGAGYKWKALTFDISAVGTNITHSNAAYDAATIPANSASTGASIYGSTEYWFRPAKLMPVFSVTASF